MRYIRRMFRLMQSKSKRVQRDSRCITGFSRGWSKTFLQAKRFRILPARYFSPFYIAPQTLLLMKSRTKIPFHLKVRRTRTNGEGEVIGKWILRKAFENLLPTEIIRRKKEETDSYLVEQANYPRLFLQECLMMGSNKYQRR